MLKFIYKNIIQTNLYSYLITQYQEISNKIINAQTFDDFDNCCKNIKLIQKNKPKILFELIERKEFNIDILEYNNLFSYLSHALISLSYILILPSEKNNRNAPMKNISLKINHEKAIYFMKLCSLNVKQLAIKSSEYIKENVLQEKEDDFIIDNYY